MIKPCIYFFDDFIFLNIFHVFVETDLNRWIFPLVAQLLNFRFFLVFKNVAPTTEKPKQEVVTVPLGPIAVGQEYYNRQGVAVCSSIVHGFEAHPNGLVVTWITRVLDKSACYTVCLLNDMLERFKSHGLLDDVSELTLWSDTGLIAFFLFFYKTIPIIFLRSKKRWTTILR